MDSAADLFAAAEPAVSLGHAEVGRDGGEFTDIRSDAPITDWSHVFAQFKLDPTEFEILGDTVRMSTWQQSKRLENGERDVINLYSYRALFRRIRDDAVSRILASLITPVKPVKRRLQSGVPMVVCLSDAQIGKDGDDTPDPEVMEARFQTALARVAGMVEHRNPSTLVIADVGDAIEGITSSAPNQIATNTLSHDDQLRWWHRRFTQTIMSLAPFAGETHVVSVPSNHTEIRNTSGKVGYGDYGLGVARTVEDAFNLHKSPLNLTFHYPATPYDVVTYVDVENTVVAFTHGHHAKALERVPQWVANQAASTKSRMGEARIVVHGHHHTPLYRESRGRAIVSCAMFDSGSPWFENLTGEHSRPAITTFNVRDRWVSELCFVEPMLVA